MSADQRGTSFLIEVLHLHKGPRTGLSAFEPSLKQQNSDIEKSPPQTGGRKLFGYRLNSRKFASETADVLSGGPPTDVSGRPKHVTFVCRGDTPMSRLPKAPVANVRFGPIATKKRTSRRQEPRQGVQREVWPPRKLTSHQRQEAMARLTRSIGRLQ